MMFVCPQNTEEIIQKEKEKEAEKIVPANQGTIDV